MTKLLDVSMYLVSVDRTQINSVVCDVAINVERVQGLGQNYPKVLLMNSISNSRGAVTGLSTVGEALSAALR